MMGAPPKWSDDGMYLAFDTSTPLGSVCLGVGARVVAGKPLRGQGSHSSDLVPAIDAVLREAGADPSELSGLVVGAGPGSFTGVRVAAATAKGLAHALDVPLWAVSSLEVGAAAVDGIGLTGGSEYASRPTDGHGRTLTEEERAWPRYVLFDARSDRVYGACYRPTESGFEALVSPHSTTIGEVLTDTPPFAVFMGDGAQKHEDEIRDAVGKLVVLFLRLLQDLSKLRLKHGNLGIQIINLRLTHANGLFHFHYAHLQTRFIPRCVVTHRPQFCMSRVQLVA